MSEQLKAMLEHLRGTRDAVRPTLATFPDLDARQLSGDLKIESRARVAGASRLPRAEAENPDSVEYEIVDFIEGRARKSQHEYHSALNNYQIRIQDSTVSDEAALRIMSAGENALATFRTQAKEDDLGLYYAISNFKETEAEYHRFRVKHGLLHRLPVLRSGNASLFAWILVSILWVVETILNGMYFAQGSTAGVIGGVVVAASLSLFNVGLAAIQGRISMPYCFHRSWLSKSLGILFSILFLVGAVALNGGIAVYRDIFVQTEGAPLAAEVFARLSPSSFFLHDANSVLLFMLGLLIHVAAVADFFSMRDRYPGYSTIGERRKAAMDRYVANQTFCIQRLDEHRQDAIEDMQQVINVLGHKQNDYQLAVQFRDRVHKDYVLHLDHLRTLGKRLVEAYRSANMEARPLDCAAPYYFRLDAPLKVPEAQDLPPAPQHTAGAHQRAVEAMADYIKRVAGEYEIIVARIEGMRIIEHGYI